ncbi:MAG TPA: hypothetical protein VMS18_08405 [Candidatus Binatia bacterium]|nr:hypothetical protein [Candidatus Binatia bacterium]
MQLIHRNPVRAFLAVILLASSAFYTGGCGGGSKLKSQTITFGSSPTLTVGGTATITATASSGLPVAYTTLTSTVCSVNSSSGLVTDLTSGLCTIAANQSGNSTYAAAPQATQSITASDNVQIYKIVTTFVEPMTDPNYSIFYGTFTYDATTRTAYNLYGVLTESMTQQGSVMTPEMTTVALGNQLSSLSDNNGGQLLSAFALSTTNVFDGGGFATGGTVYYGHSTGAINPSQGGVGNAYVTVDINLTDPETALTSAQISLEAYGDCTNLGMMMTTCMTGVDGGGTMMGYPHSQTVTLTGSTAQTITFGNAPALSAGGNGSTPTATAQATASSGLAAIYSSLTPEVCFVYQDTGGVGTYSYTTTGQTCIIAADQFGDSTYMPAARATQTYTLQ